MTIIFERTYRTGRLGHTYICDGGELGNLTIPIAFTDRGPAPESLKATIESLGELASIMAAMRGALDSIE